jgi:hypothetical protein
MEEPQAMARDHAAISDPSSDPLTTSGLMPQFTGKVPSAGGGQNSRQALFFRSKALFMRTAISAGIAMTCRTYVWINKYMWHIGTVSGFTGSSKLLDWI